MICPNCGYDVSENEAVFNNDAPSQAFHEDCYDEYYCECGARAWENGLCIDCSSDAEVEAEQRYESALEDMYEDAMHEGRV